MQIDTNVVWRHLEETDKKIVICQGGTRSGKTYNILLWLIFSYSQKYTGKTITIFRATYPALRATVMRDFFDILNKYVKCLFGKGIDLDIAPEPSPL